MFSPEKFCSNKLAGSLDESRRSSSAAAAVNHAIRGRKEYQAPAIGNPLLFGGSAVHSWQDEEISKLRRSDDVVEVPKYLLLSSQTQPESTHSGGYQLIGTVTELGPG